MNNKTVRTSVNGKANNSVRFGFVKWFDETKNTGRIKVDGELEEVQFSLNSQRVIVDGADRPQFGTDAPKESILPQSGSRVALAFKAYYSPTHKVTEKSESYGLKRVVEAAGWNFAFEWQDAVRRMTNRPVYEVVEFTLYKGEPVSEKPRRVVMTGTATEIQIRFPRGAENDPFAPEAKALDFLYRRVFYLKTDGKTTQCADPRPLSKDASVATPVPVAVEPPRPVNGNGALLASERELLALAASVNGRRNGTATLRPTELVEA